MNAMKKRNFLLCVALALLGTATARAEETFVVSASRTNATLYVRAEMPKGAHIFDESWGVTINGQKGKPLSIPLAVGTPDGPAFEHSFTATYSLSAATNRHDVEVSYQGCTDGMCMMPQTKSFSFEGVQAAQATDAPAAVKPQATETRTIASANGYLGPDDFIAFLRSARGAEKMDDSFTSDPLGYGKAHGWLLTALLVFLGGIALNLTPCVLPMIPVQLAILGIGKKRSSRGEGWKRGLVYGLGMACSYGILGAVVTITGGAFGTLQSSPWFNLAIAILFIVMALALFDVIVIDLSRFGKRTKSTAGTAAIFAMGAGAALLAGACVAPVVIAVLLLSGTLFAEGIHIAVALPFLLGLGMAFPWPFIGAGIGSMPKPGNWMRWIKIAFGAIVLLLALYYAKLAWNGFHRGDTAQGPSNSIDASNAPALATALDEARAKGKPVLIDVWATWCKNCAAMEHVTFADADVQTELENFTVLKVQAEDLKDASTAAFLNEYTIQGLPAFRVVGPANSAR